MKKLLSLVVLALAFSTFLFAQCPDGSITAPGFHPPADQLTPVERGNLYNETVQVNIPPSFDTTISGFAVTVTIDSIQVDTIYGQPSGIVPTCIPPDCIFNGGSAGCINFVGITNDSVGRDTLTVTVTAYVTVPLFGAQVQTLNMSDLGFIYYLTVVEAGALTATASAAPATICSGDSSVLTAAVTNGSGSETFAWSNGSTTNPATVSPTTTTTYTVTVTDGGNTATASTTVTVNNLPSASFTFSDAAMPTIIFTNTSTGATSYAWNFGDGSSGVDEDPTHIYTANGQFAAVLTATNSCGNGLAVDSVTITGVFIGSIENDLKFSVYPNPSEGVFTITLTDNTGKPHTIRVFDQSGKSVFEETLTGKTQKQMDLSDLPKGVYTLHLNSEKSNGVQKLIIR